MTSSTARQSDLGAVGVSNPGDAFLGHRRFEPIPSTGTQVAVDGNHVYPSDLR